MSKNKIVGIVTPTHNNASTIKATLDSIARQSYPYFEVFVTDDHSQDDTTKIVQDFCNKDPRFHLIELKTTTGAAAARNTAIASAHKDKNITYIAFLDGDDTWDKNKLKTQVDFMESTGADFSYGDYKIIYPNKDRKRCHKSPNKMSYLKMVIGCSIGCLTVMYNTRIVGKISIPNLKKRNDYALWCAILKRAKKALKYPGVLATYNYNYTGLSSGRKVRLIKYHYRMHRQVNGFTPLVASFFTFTNIINYCHNKVAKEKVIK